MTDHPSRERYPLVMAIKRDGALHKPLRAGDAFMSEDRAYYIVKLAMFPFAFYLTKKLESQDHYTIFARRVGAGTSVRFQDPIGKATLADDLKTHMELTFPLLRATLYMSLFPVMS